MNTSRHLIICEYCDSVYGTAPLQKKQKACCVCCGAVIQRYTALTLQQRLALCVTAAVLLVFANCYPVMSIRLQGLQNSATLWDSVQALSAGPITGMALVAGISIIIAPVLQVSLLLWVLTFAMANKRSPGFGFCMRWLESLRPWSMLEVCLLGAMVAVFKLAGMLDVVPGIGLAALAALSILMIKVAGRDVRLLWNQL
ncbi:paraquat-inducible protein A [Pseudomonas sp. DWP3-1-2]|jgi:paraquat-inducible protein A|uniref:paraquat-inducible protein A n=1 Tax=Pseudomonas sp. DWP3-1-2 TaxID=2804645 RepID=UPI003CEE1313